jgi:uncharacterized membrane protein|tara:strand:- start:155 stop:337 length:183 start_codon:yes stop_codon:yes gene_type:complete
MNNLEILSGIPEGLEFNTLIGSQPKAKLNPIGYVLIALVAISVGAYLVYNYHYVSRQKED